MHLLFLFGAEVAWFQRAGYAIHCLDLSKGSFGDFRGFDFPGTDLLGNFKGT